jgi:ribonucleoside-diphosphate reductase alpha chain
MQLQSDIATANPSFSSANMNKNSGNTDSAESRYSDYKIIRRNGAIAPFAPDKIAIALTKAFIAVNGGTEAASARMRDQVRELTQAVVAALLRFKPSGGTYHIEEIQDQVELALMRGGAHEVARSYVLYREKRNSERAQAKAKLPEAPASALNVTVDGKRVPLDTKFLLGVITTPAKGSANLLSRMVFLKRP